MKTRKNPVAMAARKMKMSRHKNYNGARMVTGANGSTAVRSRFLPFSFSDCMTLDFPPNDDRLMPDNEFHDESLTDDLAAVNSNNPSISENIEDKMTGNEEEKARS